MVVEIQHYEFCNDAEMCQSVDKSLKVSKLDECINSIVKKEGYISCDVTKKAIAPDGGNFLGSLMEIDIKGITVNGDKETAIFVKFIDSDCENMELLSIPSAYQVELFVYKELSQIFHELQDDANVPVKERFNTVKCYEESYEKAIIMENVTKNGFNIAGNRMDVINLEVAEECIRQLGKFHGMSFVLEQKNPKYFDKKIKSRKTAHIFGEAWQKFVEKFIKISLDFLDEELRSKIENKIPKVVGKLEKYFTDESLMYCLCHGDFRPNNIMAKKVGSKVTAIPVDYQIIWYGCPVFDFLYFMYLSTDRQFRDSHMTDLKNLYYKSLEDFLSYFDMSAESVFPRKVFEHIYQENLDYGLVISFLFCPFMFVAENTEIPDMTKTAVTDIDFHIDDRFKDRLKGAVEEFIDLGYI